MPPDFIRLPSRCNNCANVIKVDGICYKCDKKLDWRVYSPDHTWADVEKEYEECDKCPYETVLYRECRGPCPSNHPEILVTVSGLVTQTINWVGETWELPGDSGVEKRICPSRYQKIQVFAPYPTFGTNQFWGIERWNGEFDMSRQYLAAVFFLLNGSFYARGNINYGRFNGDRLLRQQLVAPPHYVVGSSLQRPSVAGWYSVFSLGGNIFLNPGMASKGTLTFNSYRIPDYFFGSKTVGSVTYTWARGNGW